MPGRDELLQQNIARAQSKAASPQPQETAGKTFVGGVGGPRSFLGGNYDVYSALESIQFQGALGDASMRGNIAYIRVWKRGGTAAQTNSGAATQDPGNNDALTVLGDAVEQEYGPEREGLPDDAVIIYDTDTLSYTAESGDLTRDEDGNIISGTSQTTFLPPPNNPRQQAIGTQTPTTSGVQSPSTQIVTPLQQNGRPVPGIAAGVGQVRSANPNGFTNALLSFGQNFIRGGLLGRVPYSGQANAPEVEAGAVPANGDMMWQFLFNPSELQLEAGPEFKGAEVWGVSDKANSGQPLHWSHNKNASLKFNSVLLNGFVFGRKVEALEQGLLELFMSREGEGQHGPHVLEFVWGKRSFGPCVIKNIDIKEKMWDEGEVVNAELSFTLEQVPEWTINDGAYVDVARPGRRALANDPTQPNKAAPATAAPAATPPGGGSQPGQKPNTPQQSTASSQADFTECKRIQSDIDAALQVKNKISGYPDYNSNGFSFERLTGSTKGFDQSYSTYTALLNKYSKSPTYSQNFSTGRLTPKCLKPVLIKGELNKKLTPLSGSSPNNEQKFNIAKAYNAQLAGCASEIAAPTNPLRKTYVDRKCTRFQSNPSSLTERL